jgi:hypothetical protein
MLDKRIQCCADGCGREAGYEVFLYDYYSFNGDVFFQGDSTCPYLCKTHVIENEGGVLRIPEHDSAGQDSTTEIGEEIMNIEVIPAGPERKYRGSYQYPHTNKQGAQGFTIYRPLR